MTIMSRPYPDPTRNGRSWPTWSFLTIYQKMVKFDHFRPIDRIWPKMTIRIQPNPGSGQSLPDLTPQNDPFRVILRPKWPNSSHGPNLSHFDQGQNNLIWSGSAQTLDPCQKIDQSLIKMIKFDQIRSKMIIFDQTCPEKAQSKSLQSPKIAKIYDLRHEFWSGNWANFRILEKTRAANRRFDLFRTWGEIDQFPAAGRIKNREAKQGCRVKANAFSGQNNGP